jgi:hypothetical protein
MGSQAGPVRRNRKVDPERVVERYRELRNLERTGREFGISRERVRQIVNRAGIETARVARPKPERPERLCRQCGAPVHSRRALYCEAHRTSAQKARRRYQRLKAEPEKYARWRQQLKAYTKRKRDRKRAADLAGGGMLDRDPSDGV